MFDIHINHSKGKKWLHQCSSGTWHFFSDIKKYYCIQEKFPAWFFSFLLERQGEQALAIFRHNSKL
jgi:hypothetical protein